MDNNGLFIVLLTRTYMSTGYRFEYFPVISDRNKPVVIVVLKEDFTNYSRGFFLM